jgi:pyruvate kinase
VATLDRIGPTHPVGSGFPTRAELLELIHELKRIRTDMLELESSIDFGQFGERRGSASNILHYVVLRRQDMRDMQDKLEAMGISSLGRSESHVLYNLNAVIGILQGLTQESIAPLTEGGGVSPLEGREILGRNADALFGPKDAKRTVRMMVTMPSEAATDYYLVRDLLEAGMDCLRINCAHDSEPIWKAMIGNLRKAEREVGRKCRVLMDIAGPKLRTGPLEPGPRVLRLKPQKDDFGRVLSPARVVFAARAKIKGPSAESFPVLEVGALWLRRLREGGQVSLKDSRGSRRTLTVVTKKVGSAVAEARKTIYFDAGTKLTFEKEGKTYSTPIFNVPCLENPILLKKGDALVVTATQEEGRQASRDEPARISCTLPEALEFVRAGERIWFDDGKIGGVVKSASREKLMVEVTHVGTEGTKLRADKGINLPDTNLKLPPLMPKDTRDLKFIVEHADMVGYSFVRTSEDLGVLRAELAGLGRGNMGIILKIETAKSFEQLPSLLLESMKGPLSGVMIARGDLAVECGFERLAEVQEEILWMSEAAHMPAIWATQVLEGLTRSGVPSRAEVTDAAVGERAECVMLNKGPHVVEALRALDSILRRMQAHQVKKRSMMRELNIASSFFKTVGAA